MLVDPQNFVDFSIPEELLGQLASLGSDSTFLNHYYLTQERPLTVRPSCAEVISALPSAGSPFSEVEASGNPGVVQERPSAVQWAISFLGRGLFRLWTHERRMSGWVVGGR